MNRTVPVFVGALLLAPVSGGLPGGPPEVSAQDPRPYLAGPAGPYRGRVVELLTERPLAGALVIMIWERDQEQDGSRPWLAFREVVTDASGDFVVDATAVETILPPRAFVPGVMVYLPGYVTYPREGQRDPFGANASAFTGAGRTVALKPVRDDEERAEALNNLVWNLGGFSAHSALPEAARFLREELRWFIRKEQESKEKPQ